MNRRCLPLLFAVALRAHAFDPAKDVAMTVAQGRLTVTIPPGAHLKCRSFKVALASAAGHLEVGPLPPAQGRDDVGDPIWRGTVQVPLRGEGLSDPVRLRITFQPCTEGPGAVCFLPQHRTLTLAAGASGLR